MPQGPQLSRFSNERARVTADSLDSAINTIERYAERYASEGIAALMTDLTNPTRIEDGSVQDGRPAINVAELKYLNLMAPLIVAFVDTPQASLGNRTIRQVVAGCSVNGSGKF
jgi:hypothetical protein